MGSFLRQLLEWFVILAMAFLVAFFSVSVLLLLGVDLDTNLHQSRFLIAGVSFLLMVFLLIAGFFGMLVWGKASRRPIPDVDSSLAVRAFALLLTAAWGVTALFFAFGVSSYIPRIPLGFLYSPDVHLVLYAGIIFIVVGLAIPWIATRAVYWWLNRNQALGK